MPGVPRPARSIAPDAPRLPDELEPATIDRAAVESGDEWRRVRIADAEAAELAVPGLRFEESRLERVDLSGGRLAHLALSDVELESANLANANVRARGATLRRATVHRCRMTGVLWTEGSLRDVVISECRIDLASFAASTLEQVIFERCVLRQTDFQDAEVRAVRFVDCDLSEADLSGARLAHCELRGCKLDGLRGSAHLRGAAMPWPDIVAAAGTFADALGVRVLDD